MVTLRDVPFTIRIVSLDYYMAPPIPHLDFCFSSLEGTTVDQVPVIRIFGSTPAGQKACVHVHRVNQARGQCRVPGTGWYQVGGVSCCAVLSSAGLPSR